jgi:membrane protein YqaA with SNARE-associated domain
VAFTVLRPIYDWMLRQAASRHAPVVLALMAFIEPIAFPVPPDIMLAPMVVKRPENIWRYVVIITVASVAGGVASYLIGYSFTTWAINNLGLGQNHTFIQYRKIFNTPGVGISFILLKSFIPVPYMLITYAAGAAHFSLIKFLMAASITRAGRFTLTAYLSKKFGPQVLARVERNLMLWTSIFVVVVVGLVVAIHQLT